ncbi:ANTAR domain-containing protein [Amycolatopsis sp. MEPSY49]|uniref:ANTAR domain-containing protein n=1 Tax=Amycolatopsis sp. MEPSY49 TaxID=3151600 RepID=UPI003EF9183A
MEHAHLRRGILMARQGLGADAAFDLLRSTSQQLDVKLTEIAAALVDSRGTLTPTPEG